MQLIDVDRYTIDDIHKQNEAILGYLKTIAEALASRDVGIGRFRGCRQKNVADKEFANTKLRDLLESKPECNFLTSDALGKLIGETGATVRKTRIWKGLSRQRAIIKQENEIQLQLNNPYLPQEAREALENRLRDLRYPKET